MQLPKLTPLQSRLLAFAITTCTVVVLWICFQPNYFAYAAEISVPPESVRHSEFEASIPAAPPVGPPIQVKDGSNGHNGDALYAPDFEYFDSSVVGRQEDELKELNNNQKASMNIAPNKTKYFKFEKSQLNKRQALEDTSNSTSGAPGFLSKQGVQDGEDVEKRQAQTQLWISATTCRQPRLTVPIVTNPPPQLKLSVWTSARNEDALPKNAKNVTFDGGYANFTLEADEDVYVAVTAPGLTQGWNGSWNFEIAASVDDGYYHNYDNATNFIYMVDTDSDSTLFITHDLTTSNDTDEFDRWDKARKDGSVPFSIYAFPESNWSSVMGLERSYCGLREQFEANSLAVTASITTKFGKGLPKGQFHVEGLNTSTRYTGFLALNGEANMTLDGIRINDGGQVFKSFQWTTKADDSCQVIFGLEECDTVAYAVPSSPQFKNNDTGLKALYDAQAKAYMQNFTRSLAQIACDTTSTAQYSLARTCTDCRNDYKAWLCSVLIPRCEDWTATDEWLHPRNINTPFADGTLPDAHNLTAEFNNTMRNRFAYNQSRNTMIDEVIKPGPYKELLPCEDLCFDIVRSCPAQLGFSCPNFPLRKLSYGQRTDPSGRNLTCNFPGAVVDLTRDASGGGALDGRVRTAVLIAGLVVGWTWI